MSSVSCITQLYEPDKYGLTHYLRGQKTLYNDKWLRQENVFVTQTLVEGLKFVYHFVTVYQLLVTCRPVKQTPVTTVILTSIFTCHDRTCRFLKQDPDPSFSVVLPGVCVRSFFCDLQTSTMRRARTELSCCSAPTHTHTHTHTHIHTHTKAEVKSFGFLPCTPQVLRRDSVYPGSSPSFSSPQSWPLGSTLENKNKFLFHPPVF